MRGNARAILVSATLSILFVVVSSVATVRGNPVLGNPTWGRPGASDLQVSGLSITPGEVVAGGRVAIRLKLQDPLVRVVAVETEVRGSAGGQVACLTTMTYDQDTGEWVGRLDIPDWAVPGAWHISSVKITDDEANIQTVADLEPASFEVSQPAPPGSMRLGSIVASDADAIRGIPATIILPVEDSSGLASVEAVFVSPSGRQRATAGVMANAASGAPLPVSLPFPLTLQLPDGSEPGRWSVESVTVRNGLGLSGRFFPGPEAGFNVESTTFDTHPPEVLAVQLSSDTVTSGGEVTVTAGVTDELTGVGSVTAVLVSPDGKASCAVPLVVTPDGQWMGSLVIPYYAAGGQWTCSIRATDRIGNTTGADESRQALLTVRPAYGESDVPRPGISGFGVSGAQRGGLFTARFAAVDHGAGVSRVMVRFEAPGNWTILAQALPDGDRGGWICSVDVPRHARSGVWRAVSATVTDGMGRETELELAPSMLVSPDGAQAQVFPDAAEDSVPPVLEATPELEEIAGRVMFRMKVRDDLSGVDSVLLLLGKADALEGPGTPEVGRPTLYLRYNPDLGVWEGGIPTRGLPEKGEWAIAGIVLTDRAGNHQVLESGLDYDLSLFNVQ